ncbi:MAG: hypothetical protein AAFR52_06010 [Pseudomonadota bacterium]
MTLGLMTAGPAVAAPFVIDDFDDDQGPGFFANAEVSTTDAAPNTAFGTDRAIDGRVSGGAATVEVSDGAFRASTSGAPSFYDFAFTVPGTISGSNALDLTGGGTNNALLIDFLSADGLSGDNVILFLSDAARNSSRIAVPVGTIVEATTIAVFFADIRLATTTSSGPLDMTSITVINVRDTEFSFFGSTQASFEIDAVRVGFVPLPAPALLLIGGLGALAFLRRRAA